MTIFKDTSAKGRYWFIISFVSLNIDRLKVGTFREGIITDARHTGRDGDRSQAGAGFEGIFPDARDAWLDDDFLNFITIVIPRPILKF